MASNPSWNFCWGRTSDRMTEKFENFEFEHFGQKIQPFEGCEELDIKEDGKFSMTVYMNRHMRSGSGDWGLWKNINKVMVAFRDHCKASQLNKEDAEKMAMSEGVLELAWINKVKVSEE